MSISNRVVIILELVVIAIMAFLAVLAFNSSGTCTWLRDSWLYHYPVINRNLTAIIFVILFAIGLVTVTLGRQGGGILTWVVVLFTIPSLLSFNSLNPQKLLNMDQTLTTQLTFWEMLAVEVMIIAGYILLNNMSTLKHTRRALLRQGARESEIDIVNSRSHNVLLLVVGSALVTVGIIILIARGFGSLLASPLTDMPSNGMLVGLACIVVIAVFIYWLGSRRPGRQKSRSEGHLPGP